MPTERDGTVVVGDTAPLLSLEGTMTTEVHDTLVYRLAQILIKLNQGERLDPRALADEFGVNLRTIQRDLNARFAYLPLQRSDGHYFLDQSFLGKFSLRDIDRFAGLAGVRGLFPSLSDDFLREIFDARIQSAILIKGHHYEDLAGKETLFRALERAIVARHHIDFDYAKAEGERRYEGVAPYKLVNHKGIWYLAGGDGGKLKTFAFGKLANLVLRDSHFPANPDVERTLVEEDGIWLNDQKTKVVMRISSHVAGYFKRRALIANQRIERELEDGELIVSAEVGHVNQVLPIVRYWIPHIRIISPEGLQDALEKEIRDYLGRPSRD